MWMEGWRFSRRRKFRPEGRRYTKRRTYDLPASGLGSSRSRRLCGRRRDSNARSGSLGGISGRGADGALRRRVHRNVRTDHGVSDQPAKLDTLPLDNAVLKNVECGERHDGDEQNRDQKAPRCLGRFHATRIRGSRSGHNPPEVLRCADSTVSGRGERTVREDRLAQDASATRDACDAKWATGIRRGSGRRQERRRRLRGGARWDCRARASKIA